MAIEQIADNTWVASPGFMDAHTHPRIFDVQTQDYFVPENNGHEGKAGLKLYSEVALRSGFTAMAAMGNETLRLPDPHSEEGTTTTPYPIFNLDRVQAAASRICGEAVIPTGINAVLDPALVSGVQNGEPYLDIEALDERLDEIDPYTLATKVFLADSFGGFAVPVQFGATIAQRAHRKHPGKPIIFHVEGSNIGKLFADIYKIPGGRHFAVDIAHVSSRQELDATIQAKQSAMNVQVEMTPHHGLLTEQSGGVVKPDLKTTQDVQYLLAHLNYIDRFGSDNAPHRLSDKRQGTPGLANHSFMVPFLVGLVRRGRLSMQALDDKLSSNTRRRFAIPTDDSCVTLDTSGHYQDPEYYDERNQVDYQQNPLLVLTPHQQQGVRLVGRIVRAISSSSHYDEVKGEVMKPSYHNLLATQTIT